MLEIVLDYLHNYFPDRDGIISGEFKITAGGIAPIGNLKKNQYFMIEGSLFNDGIHKYGSDEAYEPEEFTGVLVPMRVPPALLSIVSDMETWEANNKNGVLQSESMSSSGYSYSAATGDSGKPLTVLDAFSHKLRGWKKV